MTLQHVALEIPADRLEDCIAFWRLLDFDRLELPEQFGGEVAWIHHGATSIHLMVTDDPVVPAIGHAAVVLDSYEETLERLRAKGFEPEPRREHWGAPRAYLRDPAGHRVEVMAAPPPLPTTQTEGGPKGSSAPATGFPPR